MNKTNRSNRARMSALALSVALTMAAAIGLTTATEYQGPRRVLSTDVNAQRSVPASDGGASSLPPSAPTDDPELMRIDRSNEHHG